LAPHLCFAGEGKDGFELLTLDLSARQASMAGVATPFSVDADVFSRNPAALGLVRSPEASLSEAQLPLSVTLESAAYVHPGAKGALGFRASFLNVGGLTGYDSGGAPTGEVKAQDMAAAVGYGLRFANGGVVGAAFKQVRETIGSDGASVYALDAGWIQPMGRWPLCWELAARNLGGKGKFVDQETSLPRSYDAGLAYRGWRGLFDASVELRRGSDGTTTAAAGAETWLHRSLALRAGYDSTKGMGRGVALGLGFRIGGLRLDYSFLPQGQGFEPVHRFGLSFRFSSPGDRAYQEGLALSREGRHAEAIYKFKEALDDDPNLLGAVRALRDSVDALQKQMGQNR
jgi:hypothetical protein